MNKELLETVAVGISLPPPGTYICEAVTFAEDLGQGTFMHVVSLRFEEDLDGFSAVLVTDEDDLSQYVCQKVIASFRGEPIQGVTVLRIQKINIIQVVTTLDRTENIKLYTEGAVESRATAVFSDITEDNPMYQCVVFAADASEHTSSRSDWVEYTIIDKCGKFATTRLFNPEPNSQPIKNRYVECDLSYDKKYGFRSTYMKAVRELSGYVDPDVAICRDYLSKIISSCKPDFQKALMESKFIDNLHQNAADTNIFEAAVACHLAQDFENASRVINKQVLTEALLMQYLHTATTRGNEFISDDLTSILVLIKYNAQTQSRINAIDISAQKVYLESQIAKDLVSMAKMLVETERRLNHGSKVVACS